MKQYDLEQQHKLTEKTFPIGNHALNYAEQDSHCPPLLMLHGLGRRWQVLLPLIVPLSARWHIYAPDLRGHGKSGRAPGAYRASQYAEDIGHFLRERVHAPAVVFGHSLGGLVAMWLAANHPERVGALILGDCMISPDNLNGSMYTVLFAGLRDLAARGGSIEEIAQGLAKIELPVPELRESIAIGDLPGNDEAYLRWWARCVQRVDPETFAMAVDGSWREGWDSEALLRRIQCPTLLLQANPDLGGLMSDADVKRARELLSRATHVRFPTLGHALYMQQAEPVLRAITNFLDGL